MLNPGLYTAARGSPEQAHEMVTLHDAYDDAVQALVQPVLRAEQREFAATHYAKRAERRHIALARYRKALAEGDTSMGFSYPAD